VAAVAGAALVAFAANSLLCRGALGAGRADAVAFTFVRLASGAVVLAALVRFGRRAAAGPRTRPARAVALVAYAALFSFSYLRVPAGVGALVLFASVQATMLGRAVFEGAGPRGAGWLGVALALGGLAALTVPGAGAPDPLGVALMAGSGVAWGIYSLLGRGSAAPLEETAAAFLLATPLSLLALAGPAFAHGAHADATGALLAVASGVASGLGYVAWYAALAHLEAARAAVLQLLVPVLAAVGGVLLLGEEPSGRLAAAGVAVLAGVALALRRSGPPREAR
jgi:drug/metabolite transporter (DMT)-like permease